ncbi:MAG: ABC transporter substrate-binding protein [Verrucomicrobiota bacterium]|jgi:ABC-type Fe3+ transport system substrate-binding protein|nr:ABC transporter substrate-binding protein [Verrucomicrobiota bacterium]
MSSSGSLKVVLFLAVAVLVLPFLLRRPPDTGEWRRGDPELVIVTPHNEAIRQAFSEGFSRWHRERFGRPVRIDWRVIGGTTEIMRYLASEYAASAKRFFKGQGVPWPANGTDAVFASKRPGDDDGGFLWQAFRACDAPAEITCRMDVFFGGGTYDHAKAERQGLTVAAWGEAGPPPGLFEDAEGRVLIPEEMNGEVWRGRAYYGSVLSAFGICYNADRLADLGIGTPPTAWADLADPRYAGSLGLSDPTKSGSVAKAFEMIIHARCARTVAEAGFTHGQVRRYETLIEVADPAEGLPEGVPPAYQEAVARGWLAGVNLVRRIGANARYFTDSSGKVPSDVGMGAAAAGIAIDFFGRLQAELATPPGRPPVMTYVTPMGESSVTADPVSLLRGAPHRELAVRFIEYLLGEEGQCLWDYRAGAPGGPRRFALRRLPIRRDFYPSEEPAWQAAFERRRPFLADPLWEPGVDAYRLGESFHYEPRWTGRHFGIQRELIRAMCMDSGDELKRAWRAILAHGGPEANPEAMRALEAMPDTPHPLTWASAVGAYSRESRLVVLSEWTAFFRRQYRLAEELAGR